MNFNGGYSAIWSNINSVSFIDNTAGTYQLLWVNKHLNKFVFAIAQKNAAVSTTVNITSLTNPYPYQRELYINSRNIIINFYNNYFLVNTRTFDQPDFAHFTKNVPLIFINQNVPSNMIDIYPATNTIAQGSLSVLLLALTYD